MYTLCVTEEGVCTYPSESVPDSETVVPGSGQGSVSTQSQNLHLLSVTCQSVSQFTSVDVPHSNTAVVFEGEREGEKRRRIRAHEH